MSSIQTFLLIILNLNLFLRFTNCSIHLMNQNGKYISGMNDVVEYFTEFGYLDLNGTGSATLPLPSMSMEDLRDVIMDFQEVCSLKQTGLLDDPTIKLMNTPRCANKDRVIHHHHHQVNDSLRFQRYTLFGTKWETSPLTYKITQYSKQRGITRQLIDLEVERAFAIWENEINLEFVRSNSEQVDIELRFVVGVHNDHLPFDSSYTLAHAFYPGSGLGGDVHFNDVVDWSSTNTLLYTAVHEIGHSLGLRHSSVQDSIMFAHYIFSGDVVRLHSDDIAGAQEIYGPKSSRRPSINNFPAAATQRPFSIPISPPYARTLQTTTTTTTTNKPPPTEKPIRFWPSYIPSGGGGIIPVPAPITPHTTTTAQPTRARPVNPPYNWPQPTSEAEKLFLERRMSEICQNGIIDAILDLQNGTILVFRRDFLIPINIMDGKLVAGGIKLIVDEFQGLLPSDIDAAFTSTVNGKSYYFKGNEYWRASSGTKIDDGYPKLISEHFPGIPNKLDAAFEWANKMMYFFKGDEYWRFNPKIKPQVSSNYPSKINKNNWEGIPNYDMDAVLQLVGDEHHNTNFNNNNDNNLENKRREKTFFFRSGRYWRFDNEIGAVPTEGISQEYPRDARIWWFGCKSDFVADLDLV